MASLQQILDALEKDKSRQKDGAEPEEAPQNKPVSGPGEKTRPPVSLVDSGLVSRSNIRVGYGNLEGSAAEAVNRERKWRF